MRAVRLNNPIRRVVTEQVTIQFGRDLVAEITVVVKPDRIIEMETSSTSQRTAEPSADDAQFDEPSDDAPKGKSGNGKSDDGKSDRGTKSARKNREKSSKE